jgi:cyclophilin family peptidyl-prolyl cis-trans isomerase
MVQAYTAGLDAGIPGTPFIFLNGLWYRLNPTRVNLEASIRLELLRQEQFTDPPQVELDLGKLYYARLQLTQGEILIQLYPEEAPATVASFIFLAEQGWFNGTGFHSVEAGRRVDGGDPTGTGLGGPGYLLRDELSATLTFDEPGMIAMSSSGPDTNGSRFFINLIPLPQLNNQRTIFGKVVSGLELLTDFEPRDPYDDLFEPYLNSIESIRIEIR